MRNVEDLMLNTLVEVIAEGTGISSGNIWLKMPEPEFVNKRSGSRDSLTNSEYLPAIGINYMRDAFIKHNNYGSTRYVNESTTIATQYTPLAELQLNLAIHLYAKSHEDMNYYGNLLYYTLLRNRMIEYRNDSIQGEYFSVMFKSMRYIGAEKPIHKVFLIDCCGRMLDESTGYIVREIDTTVYTYDTDIDVVVSGGITTVTYDSSNPLVIDDFDEFEDGTLERTTIV